MGRKQGQISQDELAALFVQATQCLTHGEAVCFAMSGGVDSTLLTALASRTEDGAKPVAFTAQNAGGQDFHFASKAAEALPVELNIVRVPEGEEALDLHWHLSKLLGHAVEFRGNSLAFASVCEQAKSAGYTMIVDGTGAEQRVAGNVRLLPHFVNAARREGRDDLAEAVIARHGDVKASGLPKGVKDFEFASLKDAIDWDWHSPLFRRWVYHHHDTQKATGLKIAMPFLAPELEILTRQPLDFYYPDGWMKGPYRQLLARYVGDDVAYRRDDQGLRWEREKRLQPAIETIKKTIRDSPLYSDFSTGKKLRFRFDRMPLKQLLDLYLDAVDRAVRTS